MVIEHIAIKTADIDSLCRFYCTYFGMEAEAEITGSTGNRIIFLHPAAGTDTNAGTDTEKKTGIGTRIELMQNPGTPCERTHGYVHMAFSAGGEDAVSALVRRMQAAGATILRQPLRTPSGTLLAAVADPDGNPVEIVP